MAAPELKHYWSSRGPGATKALNSRSVKEILLLRVGRQPGGVCFPLIPRIVLLGTELLLL
jgi:hypothetical protein